MANIKQVKLGSTSYEILAKYIQDTDGNQKDWSDIVAIAAAAKLELKVVDSLPTASANTMNAIYLVAEQSISGTYAEYVTLRSGTEGSYIYAWEKIGTTAADLADYAKKGTYTSSNTGAHTHTVSGTVTVPTIGKAEKKLAVSITDVAIDGKGTANAITGLTPNTDSVLGAASTFVVTGGAAQTTHVTASITGVAVGANGTANAVTGYAAPTTDSVLGANSTFTVTGGAAQTTGIKATASGVAVGANGTANAVTGYAAPATGAFVTGLGTPSTGSALGSAATFNTEVTLANKNIVATASGVAVGANGTANAVTGYNAPVSQKLAMGSVTGVSGNTTASKVTVAGSAAAPAWDATVSSDGVLSFSWDAGSVQTVTATDINVPIAAASATNVVTGLTTTGTGANVLTGLGTASTAAVLTGVKVTAQPTVTIATAASGGVSVATGVSSAATTASGTPIEVLTGLGTPSTSAALKGLGTPTTASVLKGVKVTAQPTVTIATAAAGDVSVATGVSAISVAASGDNVSALTGLGTASTAAVLTGVKVTTQPTVSLATATTGGVTVATGVSDIAVSASGDNVDAMTGFATIATAAVLTGVKVTTQPTVSLDGNAATGVNYVSGITLGTKDANIANGLAAENGAHEHTTTI